MKSFVKITIMIKKNNLPVKQTHPSRHDELRSKIAHKAFPARRPTSTITPRTPPFPKQKIQSLSSFPLKKLSRMQNQSTIQKFIKSPFLASSLQITLTNLGEG